MIRSLDRWLLWGFQKLKIVSFRFDAKSGYTADLIFTDIYDCSRPEAVTPAIDQESPTTAAILVERANQIVPIVPPKNNRNVPTAIITPIRFGTGHGL